MMRILVLFVTLIASSLTPGIHAQATQQPPTPLLAEQKVWLKLAERYEKNGWIYLRIQGEPRERGFQYGYVMAKEIAEAIRVRREIWNYTTSMTWEWLVEKSAAMYTPTVDAENRSELEGMAEGLRAAGVESRLDELVAFNAWFDLAWYWCGPRRRGNSEPSPPTHPSKPAAHSLPWGA
jgi:hypothetical protein